MARPKVFLSSTYLDLRDARDYVGEFLGDQGLDVVRAERGGVFYDPNAPLDQSCYQEIPSCHLFVLLIGGRYGSRSSDSSSAAGKYKSIVAQELSTAVNCGIPILVFVRDEVAVEFSTYMANPKKVRAGMTFVSVDNVQIFDFLGEIYRRKRGNPVYKFREATDITSQLKTHLAGFLADALKSKIEESTDAKVRINGYKLFYHREQRGLSQAALADRVGVKRPLITRLEHVSEKAQGTAFAKVHKGTLQKIEDELGCRGALEIGQADDSLTMYIHHYSLYRHGKRKSGRLVNDALRFRTRALVVDFDGTLTVRPEDDLTTWERLWVEAGYTVNDCAELARKYIKNGKVSPSDHKSWCLETAQKLRDAGLSQQDLIRVAEGIELIPGAREELKEYHRAGINLHMASGSISQIISHALGDETFHLFDEVQANNLSFDEQGVIREIRGTRYDFEGKAEFISNLVEKQDISPLEVLFVGNSLNDIWASNAGARTLCVNPHFTNPNDTRDWTYCIRRMDHFSEIRPYLGWPELLEEKAG